MPTEKLTRSTRRFVRAEGNDPTRRVNSTTTLPNMSTLISTANTKSTGNLTLTTDSKINPQTVAAGAGFSTGKAVGSAVAIGDHSFRLSNQSIGGYRRALIAIDCGPG